MSGRLPSEACVLFGLVWGASRSEVRSRFQDTRPVADEERALVYRLASLVCTVSTAGGLFPSAMLSGSDRPGDEAVFGFSRDRLVSVQLGFSYGFGEIGQDPDALSEQAMSAFARAEMHRAVFEFASRYGPPALLSEVPNRRGRLHVQGTALFGTEVGPVQLVFGHDGGSFLAGEVRYCMAVTDGAGL